MKDIALVLVVVIFAAAAVAPIVISLVWPTRFGPPELPPPPPSPAESDRLGHLARKLCYERDYANYKLRRAQERCAELSRRLTKSQEKHRRATLYIRLLQRGRQ